MKFRGLLDFYPYYLGQHRNGVCRALHTVGSLTALGLFIAFLTTHSWPLLLATPFAGYGLAWVGHFGFEKNRPATFQHPLLSLACDWIMLAEILSFRIPLFGDLPEDRWKPQQTMRT